ncbi:Lrp/AsnC family transcriptional regulator [Nakamurella flavida]|uniref:Lrp/AsnC family transcriptional regulator n=1 Tax=Nakamurella flavida TaxID=363630 RepID=A0A938YKM7_9ACTN|nr:Lrp/AsnC family transcriptional regulator [Nakamurella flavida]MBM9476291.1 Lrp/AsnC family transcriptional regulator [Nakamurella flavida]MDP9779609.1 DNA-binding Lrp family transcriptional regulator [Nakamurella flavida]
MDHLDAALISALRTDGRARQQELAAAVGMSRSAVALRLSAMLAAGTIRVVGVVHPSVLGLHSVAHISVTVDGPVRAVAERLAAESDTPFVSLVAGAVDLIAEVRVPDPVALARALTRIRAVPGVRRVSTLTVTSLVLDVMRPTAGSAQDIDRVDRALLELLQTDGRMSLVEMSRQTGLAVGTVRTRVRRLIDERIVRVGVLVSAGVGEQEYAVGVGVTLSGPADGDRDLVEALSGRESTRFLATTTGRFDLVATVHAPTMARAVELVDEVRQLPGVSSLESWVHLSVIKERYQTGSPGPDGALGPAVVAGSGVDGAPEDRGPEDRGPEDRGPEDGAQEGRTR